MSTDLEAAAHVYAYYSDTLRPSNPESVTAKGTARLKLQTEALRYAADFLEKWTQMVLTTKSKKMSCEAGIEQLRELVADAEKILQDREQTYEWLRTQQK